MLGRLQIKSLVTSNIFRCCVDRSYHVFRRPNNLIYHDTILQAGRAPGLNSIMPIGRPRAPGYPPSKVFTFQNMRKHYGVLPIVGIMGFVMVGLAAVCIRAACIYDIDWPKVEKKPGVKTDLRNPHNQKFIKIRHYQPNEELAWLLDEMDRAQKGPATPGGKGDITDDCP